MSKENKTSSKQQNGNDFIADVSKSFKNKKRRLMYMGIDKWGQEISEYVN